MATVTIERLFVTPDPVPVSISLQNIHSHDGSRRSSPAPPRPPQPVFEAARLKPLRRGQRAAVTVLLIAANIVQMISNALAIVGGLGITQSLGLETGPGKANWVAASYGLTQGTFVLLSGRLGAVHGHRNALVLGVAWLAVWSLINGFCDSFITFNLARAMSGIGGALIMPNAVAMIGVTCPPGKTRNLSMGFFGASAPIAGAFGGVFAGAVLEYVHWKWMFFAMAIMSTVVLGLLWFVVPPEQPVDPRGSIDWIGAALGTSGLIIFNAAWNQAPAVGWSTPYEVVLVTVSVALLAIFALWEYKYAKVPLMPLDIWTAPSFFPLVIVALFGFMSFGTLLWYMIAWQQEVRHWSVLHFGIGWAPFGVFGVLGAILAGWLIPRLAAQWILAIGIITVLISNLLLATMPDQQTYWAQLFPATILMAFCPDLVYTAAQIIACNSVRRAHQGTAASLVGLLNLYGNSLGLGFAGTVETEVNKHVPDMTTGYRAALYFGAGIAAIGLFIDMTSVRMVRDEREGWEDPADDMDIEIEPQGMSTATTLRG